MTIAVTAADWMAVMPIVVLASAGLLVLLADVFARSHSPRYLSLAIGALGAG